MSVLENIYIFTNKDILYLLKKSKQQCKSITKIEYYTLAKAIFKVL